MPLSDELDVARECFDRLADLLSAKSESFFQFFWRFRNRKVRLELVFVRFENRCFLVYRDDSPLRTNLVSNRSNSESVRLSSGIFETAIWNTTRVSQASKFGFRFGSYGFGARIPIRRKDLIVSSSPSGAAAGAGGACPFDEPLPVPDPVVNLVVVDVAAVVLIYNAVGGVPPVRVIRVSFERVAPCTRRAIVCCTCAALYE